MLGAESGSMALAGDCQTSYQLVPAPSGGRPSGCCRMDEQWAGGVVCSPGRSACCRWSLLQLVVPLWPSIHGRTLLRQSCGAAALPTAMLPLPFLEELLRACEHSTKQKAWSCLLVASFNWSERGAAAQPHGQQPSSMLHSHLDTSPTYARHSRHAQLARNKSWKH